MLLFNSTNQSKIYLIMNKCNHNININISITYNEYNFLTNINFIICKTF